MPVIRRTAVAVAAITALLAVSTACGPEEGDAASPPKDSAQPSQESADPGGLPSLEDLKKWKDGGWKDWENWARKASEFVNPVIKDLWQPERMAKAAPPPTSKLDTSSGGNGYDQHRTDPVPPLDPAKQVQRPYHERMAPIGKIFFDSPKGPMVCSGTVVKDPANPGKSNLVWTAGHCVHGGTEGGWMRNLVFVPSYNNNGVPLNEVSSSPSSNISPYGVWWADWTQTSSEWIENGTHVAGAGHPYDFAVMHVQPENGGGKSLEETVGAAVDIWFDAPSHEEYSGMSAYGYPAAEPFDGSKMMTCTTRPARLSVTPETPSMFRIGCDMTGGSSGGGWLVNRDGETVLVSNTSLGAFDKTWLAAPYLGPEAKGVYDAISAKFARR